MKITKNINNSIVAAASGMLSPFVPELTPSNLIEALSAYGKDDKPQEKPLTINQVAERLQISRMTVCRLINRGELPAFRVGKRSVRISHDDVESLLQNKAV